LVWAVARRLAPVLGEEIEELHGAGVVEVLKRLPRYKPEKSPLKAYIGYAAAFGMRSYIRDQRHTRRQGYEGVKLVGPGAAWNVGRWDGQEQAVMARELWAFVDRLKPRWAAVMRMYYGQGLYMRECGDRLGVNESRVSQIHKAAIRELRRLMGIA